MRWRIWLRRCATNREVADSFPGGVIWNFHWHNPSGHSVSLGSIQLLTEISTTNIFWGKGDRRVGLTTLTPSCNRFSWNLGAPKSWKPHGLSSDCFTVTFSFIFSFSWVRERNVRYSSNVNYFQTFNLLIGPLKFYLIFFVCTGKLILTFRNLASHI